MADLLVIGMNCLWSETHNLNYDRRNSWVMNEWVYHMLDSHAGTKNYTITYFQKVTLKYYNSWYESLIAMKLAFL